MADSKALSCLGRTLTRPYALPGSVARCSLLKPFGCVCVTKDRYDRQSCLSYECKDTFSLARRAGRIAYPTFLTHTPFGSATRPPLISGRKELQERHGVRLPRRGLANPRSNAAWHAREAELRG